MQQPEQPSSGILATAYNSLLRGTRFFANLCARRSDKKRQTYGWEERLAKVPDINVLEIGPEGSGTTKHITITRLLYKRLLHHLTIFFSYTSNNPQLNDLQYSKLPTKKQEPQSRHIFIWGVHTAFPNTIGLAISFALAILKFFAWPLGFGVLGPIGGGLAACFQSVFGTPWLFRVLQRFAMG
ncbi:hypothetical protein KCU98_g8941, partial [Aureobasidium melanogenum]